MKKAVVTLALGDVYIDDFKRNALPTWQPYCDKYGYDLVVITEPIVPLGGMGGRSLHWQKLLVGLLPQLKDYDWLVWVDGDILMNAHNAPCIVSQMGGDKIGVVSNNHIYDRQDRFGSFHTRFLLLNYLMARDSGAGDKQALVLDDEISEYYRLLGLNGSATKMINTGVMVFNARRHGEFLASVYAKYDADFPDYEQTPLSFELQDKDMIQPVDRRFNRVWSQVVAEHYPFLFNRGRYGAQEDVMSQCVNATYQNSWFLHFAGAGQNPVTKKAFNMVDPGIEGVCDLVFPKLWETREDYIRFASAKEFNAIRNAMTDEEKEKTLKIV